MRDIYITADPHFLFDEIERFCVSRNTTKEDLMIILGDACLNYYKSKKDTKLKRRVENIPITFLFVYGNHEIRPEHISSYKPITWNNGLVYVEDSFPSLLFADDGEVFNINNKNFLIIGGAYSVDRYYREGNGLLWMDDEQPSKEDIGKAKKNLEKYHIDYILTHTCPKSFIPHEALCTEIDPETIDNSTEEIFDYIYNNYAFMKWYCGHFHINKNIGKMSFIYKKIVKLSTTHHLPSKTK